LDPLPNIKVADIEPFISILEHIRASSLLRRFNVDIGARLADVEERVRQLAELRYTEKMDELRAAPGVNRALPLLLITDEIEKTAKLLDKKFPDPIIGLVYLLGSRAKKMVCL